MFLVLHPKNYTSRNSWITCKIYCKKNSHNFRAKFVVNLPIIWCFSCWFKSPEKIYLNFYVCCENFYKFNLVENVKYYLAGSVAYSFKKIFINYYFKITKISQNIYHKFLLFLYILRD